MAKILNINDDIKLNLDNIDSGRDIQSASYAAVTILNSKDFWNWGYKTDGSAISSLIYPGFYRIYNPSDNPTGRGEVHIGVIGFHNDDGSYDITQICITDLLDKLYVRRTTSQGYTSEWYQFQRATYSLSGNDLYINF